MNNRTTKRHALKFAATILVLAGLMCTACRRKDAMLPPPVNAALDAAQTEDWSTARDLLSEAIEVSPGSLTVQMNLAMLHWRTGNLNDAIAAFNQIVNRDTFPQLAWELYAQLQLDAGNPHATIELLQNIATPTPRSLTLHAMADIKMQNYDRAVLSLERAIELDEAYAPAWYHLAVMHRDHLSNRVEAQNALRNFQALAPQNPLAQISLNDFIGLPLPDPIPTTDETLQAATVPEHDARQEHLQESISEARRLTEQGSTDAALLALKAAVKNHPNNPDAVWELARFYDQQLGITDRADGLYNMFIQLFPNDPRASQIPSRARTRQGQRATGNESVRQTLLFQQGIEHYNRQEWDAAITAYRRALAIAPNDTSAAFNLGLTYHKINDLDAAAIAFQQALEHEPDMIKSLYMLGLTERDRSNIPEALHLLNRVIRMQPDFVKAHQVLGRIYYREGRPDMTAIHFKRILEIDADTDEARRARAWLDEHQNQ